MTTKGYRGNGGGPGVAVVTGASSGIGAVFATRLAESGHDLLLAARRGDRLEEIAARARREHGVQAASVAADLSRPEGVDQVLSALGDRHPAFLVCSAGFGTRKPYFDLDESRIVEMIGLHVVSAARLTRACLPRMVEQGRGSVVLLSSMASFWLAPTYATYAATKAFLNALALGLAEDLRGTGVHVQALCPGLTRTEFLETEEYAEFDYSGVPAAFWMSAEQVVDESLAALGRGEVVFVPGAGNRAFVRLMNGPTGPLVRGTIAVVSRITGKTLY